MKTHLRRIYKWFRSGKLWKNVRKIRKKIKVLFGNYFLKQPFVFFKKKRNMKNMFNNKKIK